MLELITFGLALAALHTMIGHLWEKRAERQLAAAQQGEKVAPGWVQWVFIWYFLLGPAVISYALVRFVFTELMLPTVRTIQVISLVQPYATVPIPGGNAAGRTDNYLLACAALVLPMMAGMIALAVLTKRREKKSRPGVRDLELTARDKRRATFTLLLLPTLIGFLQALGITFAMTPPAFGWISVLGPLLALVVLCMVFMGQSTPIKKTKPFELEEGVPLHAEISAIAAAFGLEKVKIQIRPVRLKNEESGQEPSAAEIAAHLQAWNQLPKPKDLTLSLELLRRLDPSVVTAVLALAYAKRIKLPASVVGSRLARWSGQFGKVLLWIVVFVVFVVIFSGQRGGGPSTLMALVVLFGLQMAVILAVRLVPAFRRHSQMECAFRAWRDADPEAGRTPEAFFTALVVHDRLLVPALTDEALIGFASGNRKLAKFLKAQGEGTLERAIEMARAAITEERSEASGTPDSKSEEVQRATDSEVVSSQPVT